MAAHNKCNIAKSVLERLSSLTWGLDCKDVTCSILENYVEYLDCDNVKQNICIDPDNCVNDPIYFSCRFNIISISSEIPVDTTEYDISFSLNGTNYAGGTQPFTYNWTYDTNDFDPVGDVDSDTIKLKLKPGKVLSLIVSNISVSVIDANECSDSKNCVIDAQIMHCNQFYEACYNPQSLTVHNLYVACTKPKNLVVAHI